MNATPELRLAESGTRESSASAVPAEGVAGAVAAEARAGGKTASRQPAVHSPSRTSVSAETHADRKSVLSQAAGLANGTKTDRNLVFRGTTPGAMKTSGGKMIQPSDPRHRMPPGQPQ
jgi:hypothetical protein